MTFRYSDHGVPPGTKCKICGERASAIRKQYGDHAIEDGAWSEKLDGWVCFPCRESEDYDPKGTIVIFKPKEGIVEKWVIKGYSDDLFTSKEGLTDEDLEFEERDFEYSEEGTSPIQFEWHRTDAWRGYYDPKGEGWKKLHEDCALAYSADEQALKDFDTEVKKVLWNQEIEFAICFGRTSNLFSTGYDIYVHEPDDLKYLAAIILVNRLKTQYRDPERFRLTALTGKDTFDEKDKLLGEAQQRLQRGEDFETVSNDILKKASEIAKEEQEKAEYDADQAYRYTDTPGGEPLEA